MCHPSAKAGNQVVGQGSIKYKLQVQGAIAGWKLVSILPAWLKRLKIPS
jgi:hypothetical protein